MDANDPDLTDDAAPRPNVDVDHGVPCWRCGYDLRGLSRHGRCPECGAAVIESLARHAVAPPPLSELDPRWVWALAGSCALLTIAALGGMAVAVLTWMPEPILRRWMPPMSTARSVLVWLPVELLLGLGAWTIGRPAPGRPPPVLRWDEVCRVAARWTGAVSAAWAVLILLAMLAMPRPPSPGRWVVAGLLGAASSAAGYAHLAQLCARMRRPAMAKACHIVAGGLGATLALRAAEAAVAPSPRLPITAPDPFVGDLSLLVWTTDRLLPGGVVNGLSPDPSAAVAAAFTLAAVLVLPVVTGCLAKAAVDAASPR